MDECYEDFQATQGDRESSAPEVAYPEACACGGLLGMKAGRLLWEYKRDGFIVCAACYVSPEWDPKAGLVRPDGHVEGRIIHGEARAAYIRIQAGIDPEPQPPAPPPVCVSCGDSGYIPGLAVPVVPCPRCGR